jgi:hypothetical protein
LLCRFTSESASDILHPLKLLNFPMEIGPMLDCQDC